MSAEHEAMKQQLANPKQHKKDNHIRLSTIWNTTQGIRSIQRDLALGASFDVPKMQELVNTMFGFINSVAKPVEEGEDKSAEVKHDTVTSD